MTAANIWRNKRFEIWILEFPSFFPPEADQPPAGELEFEVSGTFRKIPKLQLQRRKTKEIPKTKLQTPEAE
jgi:hypothetical protein